MYLVHYIEIKDLLPAPRMQWSGGISSAAALQFVFMPRFCAELEKVGGSQTLPKGLVCRCLLWPFPSAFFTVKHPRKNIYINSALKI